MDILVRISQTNGHFEATSMWAPQYRAEGATREEAVAAFRRRIQEDVNQSEVVRIEVEPHPITAMAGIFKDDPDLQEITDEIYRRRDRDRTEEHQE